LCDDIEEDIAMEGEAVEMNTEDVETNLVLI
jgi:hypothetical protein